MTRILPIPGYEDCYSIDIDGTVWSHHTSTIKKLKVYKDQSGYYRHNLWKNGKYKTIKVHRLVALTFMEGFNGEDLNHLDGDKSNNSLTNLEITNDKDNIAHAYRLGLKHNNYMKGELNHMSICSDKIRDQVAREYLSKKYTTKELMFKYNLKAHNIYTYAKRIGGV